MSGSSAAGREDPVAADDHGAVVELRAGREDRAQQLARQVGVEHHAGLGDLLEAGLALEHDQRPVALARQLPGGLRDLGRDVLDRALLGRRERASRTCPTRPIRSSAAAQLGLEHDDEREQADDGARLEDLGEQPELEELGEGVDAEQDRDADDEA